MLIYRKYVQYFLERSHITTILKVLPYFVYSSYLWSKHYISLFKWLTHIRIMFSILSSFQLLLSGLMVFEDANCINHGFHSVCIAHPFQYIINVRIITAINIIIGTITLIWIYLSSFWVKQNWCRYGQSLHGKMLLS